MRDQQRGANVRPPTQPTLQIRYVAALPGPEFGGAQSFARTGLHFPESPGASLGRLVETDSQCGREELAQTNHSPGAGAPHQLRQKHATAGGADSGTRVVLPRLTSAATRPPAPWRAACWPVSLTAVPCGDRPAASRARGGGAGPAACRPRHRSARPRVTLGPARARGCLTRARVGSGSRCCLHP